MAKIAVNANKHRTKAHLMSLATAVPHKRYKLNDLRMRAYAPYVSYLERLLFDTTSILPTEFKAINKPALTAALDGEPSRELRDRISLNTQRATGSFFTGQTLADQLAKFLKLKKHNFIVDPACGVGDLLVATARKLPIAKDLKTTLSTWSSTLGGFDLHPQFIQSTKVRLILLAIYRGVIVDSRLSKSFLQNVFNYIQIGDGLKNAEQMSAASHLVMNPPYTMMQAAKSCKWAGGSVSTAAVFLESYLSILCGGSQVLAILPDVLRTGTRYRLWRREIQKKANINNIKIIGQFDKWADVDVFILNLTIKQKKTLRVSWKTPNSKKGESVGDYFDVRVGPVVPFRDPYEGDNSPYIVTKDLPRWETLKKIDNFRKFSGTLYRGPFVAVRRVSRPGDKHRAVGTIVSSREKIAVENHVLILKPKKNSITACRRQTGARHPKRGQARLPKTIELRRRY